MRWRWVRDPVIVCPVVYVELAAHFANTHDLDRFLGDAGVQMTKPS